MKPLNPYEAVVDDLLKWGIILPEDKISIEPDSCDLSDEPIFFCLGQTDRYFSFDPEAGMYPVDYQDFFEEDIFKKIAKVYGIQFEVEAQIKQTEKKEIGEDKYLVTIRFKGQEVSQQMRDYSDFYDEEAIPLLINNVLKCLGGNDIFEDLGLGEFCFLLAPKNVLEELRKKYLDPLYL